MEFVPLWTDILDAPNWKILDLPPELFRFWAFCLMAAQKHDYIDGFLPEERTLSRWFGMPVTEALHLRDRLVTGGLIDAVTDGEETVYRMHDWQEWKATKDKTALKRQREKRARDKALRETVTPTSRNGHEPVTPTSRMSRPHHTATSIQNDEEEDARASVTEEPDDVVKFGRLTFGERFDLNSIGQKIAGWRAANYPDSWIKDAMLCANCSAEGNISAYINKVLREWRAKGGPVASEIVKAQSHAATRHPVEYFTGSPDMLAPPGVTK